MNILLICMYVHHCVPVGSPRNGVTNTIIIMWVLGIRGGSFERAVSALNH